MLISPQSTLNSWGNSSILTLRMKRPTRVTRSSFLVAQRGLPSFSASVRMLRNLMTLKGTPFKPTRSCRYSTGPRDSMQMTRAVTSMMGQATDRIRVAKTTSQSRLIAARSMPWLKPSPNTNQPALTCLMLICASVFSKCVAMSTTRTPDSLQSSNCRSGMLPPRRSVSATTISSTLCLRAASVRFAPSLMISPTGTSGRSSFGPA
mmetsp:Transcript_26276/g.62229  ORF Transcript_26276/g.62229 Transcript_26276/m.62229 type:complete len:206 (-) Transcript_26276:242-859(-)